MSQLRVDEITDELGTGSPAFPNGTPGFPLTSSDMPTGSVIQVVQAIKRSAYTVNLGALTTDTQNVPGFEVSITPISTSSKILVTVVAASGYNQYLATGVFLYKNGSPLTDALGEDGSGNAGGGFTAGWGEDYPINYLDSPNTTSSITYGIRLRNVDNRGSRQTGIGSMDGSGGSTAFEDGTQISTITAMEIAG